MEHVTDLNKLNEISRPTELGARHKKLVVAAARMQAMPSGASEISLASHRLQQPPGFLLPIGRD